MFDTNEYFDGKVKSIAFENEKGKYTVGVMASGDYEFGTSSNEEMTVISGKLIALLPEESEWKTYEVGSSFEVVKDSKFKVKAEGDSSYLCRYW